MRFVYQVDGRERIVTVEQAGERMLVTLDGQPIQLQTGRTQHGFLLRTAAGQQHAVVAAAGHERMVHLAGQTHRFQTADARPRRARASNHSDLTAQMPGIVTDLRVAVGDIVSAGQVLLVIEAMKMEIRLTAPTDGVVNALHTQRGSLVERGQTLVEIG